MHCGAASSPHTSLISPMGVNRSTRTWKALSLAPPPTGSAGVGVKQGVPPRVGTVPLALPIFQPQIVMPRKPVTT